MQTLKPMALAVVVAALLLGSLTAVSAQDQLPAVDLLMWHQERDQPVQDAITTQFERWAEMYAPGSTLSLTYYETEDLRNQLLTAALAGSGLPDFFTGPNDPIGVYVDAGLVQPLDDLFDTSIFSEGSLEAASLGGTLYGIPYMAGNHLMLMYNKDYVETAPDTWDELIEVAKAVEAANPDVQGLAYHLNEPFWLLPFVHGFGGSVFDDEGNFTINTEPWVEAFDFVQSLKFDAQITPQECDYDCLNSLFAEGSAAMILNGDWSISVYTDLEQAPGVGADKLGIAPWPRLPNGERPKPFVSGRYFSIPVTTSGDKLEAIKSFLTFLSTDPEAILALTASQGRLPAIPAANEFPEVADNPLLASSAAALETGTGMPANTELRCMWDAVRPQLQGVMANSTTAEEAAAAAQVSAEQCVATLE